MSAEQPPRGDGCDGPLSAHELATPGDCGNSEVPLEGDSTNLQSDVLPSEIFTHAPCGLALLGMDGSLIEANQAFRDLCGITADLSPNWNFPLVLSRAGSIFYETHLIPVLILRGTLNEVALDLIHPGGEQIPVLMNANLQRRPDETPSMVRIALFKAKERRQYERELLQARRNSEQMAEVVRRSSDAIVAISPEGMIRSWNKGAEQMFARSSTEAIGRPFLELLFSDAAGQEVREVIPLLHKGQEVSREAKGVRKDGHELDLLISFTPHMEAPGILVAFSAIIRDITSRKLSQRALLQNEKLASVGRLASSIAHEINNPLESVTNLLYILASRVDPENLELVSLAQEELARVSQIATYTLRFHKQSSNRTLVDVKALCDSVLGLYRGRLKNAGIVPVIDIRSVSPLLCFEGELRQVLVNLVANAFDAMRAGGRLTLRSREATVWPSGVKGVRLTVADTGTGMDRTTLQHLFEPFFSTKGIGGTGLGLWISKDLVEKNQGRIKIRSSTRTDCCGTAVSIFFPHAPRPATIK